MRIAIEKQKALLFYDKSIPLPRFIRKIYYLFERIRPFILACFSTNGFVNPIGRRLIWGKFRRIFINMLPPLVQYLKKHYKISGHCVSCGTSCNLLFQCPQWDPKTKLCTIYEDRPRICKTFPITPSDIKDRDLVSAISKCGFDSLLN